MSELTINKLIKLILAGVVLVVVILGLYFAMTSYVIPFFKGLGFGSDGPGGDGFEEVEICEGKELVGSLEKDGDKLYFVYEGEKTVFYINKDKIYRARFGFVNDQETGEIVDDEIIILDSVLTEYRKNEVAIPGSEEFKKFKQLLALEHSVIKGYEICKL